MSSGPPRKKKKRVQGFSEWGKVKMNLDGQTIEIINWDEYNPKRDQKTYTWLRLDNGISTDVDLFGLDAEQKFVWIEILCQASKKNTGFVTLNVGYLEHITGVKKAKIHALVTFLQENGKINVHDNLRPRAVVPESEPPVVTTPTYVRTYERDERNETNVTNENSIGGIATAIAPSAELPVETKKTDPATKEAQNQKARQFVGAYVKAYQAKFPDGRPEDLNDGKIRGQILNWIKEYPLDRACDLIQTYFQMDSKWFGTKGYDFLTFRNNLNKVGQALDSGADPDGNKINWEKVFSAGGVA